METKQKEMSWNSSSNSNILRKIIMKNKKKEIVVDDVQRFLEVFSSHQVDVARVAAASP